MRTVIFPLSFAVFVTSAAAAGLPESINTIPLAECNLRSIRGVIHHENMNRQAQMAGRMIPLLEEMEAIAAKAPKSNVSVGEQLSRDDSSRFAEIRQKMISISGLKLIESNRVRDFESVIHLTETADRNYRWQTEVPESSPERVYQDTIFVMRAVIPKRKLFEPTISGACSTDLALNMIESEALTQANNSDVESASRTLTRMAAKYNMKQIERDKLSEADRVVYDKIDADVIKPIQRANQLFNDIENIKLVAKAAGLIYETGKQDLASGGGDYANVGATIAQRAKNNELDPLLAVAITMVREIGEKVPSDQAMQLNAQSKAVEAVKPKYQAKNSRE
jgi:hypothetical protein